MENFFEKVSRKLTFPAITILILYFIFPEIVDINVLGPLFVKLMVISILILIVRAWFKIDQTNRSNEK